MKKSFSIKEAVYTLKPEEIEIEKIETVDEHVVSEPVPDFKINILVDENKFTEDCNEMKATINREDFRSLFGSKSKPRKGDVLSITGLAKKFKVKKSKKFSAGKKGRGYKVNLKAV
jgi:hypothetical protein